MRNRIISTLLLAAAPLLSGCEFINAWGEAAQQRDMARHEQSEKLREEREVRDLAAGRYSGKLTVAVFFDNRGSWDKALTAEQFKSLMRSELSANQQFALYPEAKIKKKLGDLYTARDRFSPGWVEKVMPRFGLDRPDVLMQVRAYRNHDWGKHEATGKISKYPKLKLSTYYVHVNKDQSSGHEVANHVLTYKTLVKETVGEFQQTMLTRIMMPRAAATPAR